MGQKGRWRKRRGRRRWAGQVDALEDCLTHLLDFGHQLLLRGRKTTVTGVQTEPIYALNGLISGLITRVDQVNT